MNKLSSKQRSFLIGEASKLPPMFQLGKEGLTPEFAHALREALDKNELLKINVLKSSDCDPKEAARTLSERTSSTVVTVIGRKIVLFKYQNDPSKRRFDI